jgi:hypothetical protein
MKMVPLNLSTYLGTNVHSTPLHITEWSRTEKQNKFTKEKKTDSRGTEKGVLDAIGIAPK